MKDISDLDLRYRQRMEQLEAENRELKTQLIQIRESAKQNEFVLAAEKERLQVLDDHFSNGTLFRFRIKASAFASSNTSSIWLKQIQLVYASATWEKISNISLDETLQNPMLLFLKIHSDDLSRLTLIMYECLRSLSNFNLEIRYHYTDDDMRWFQLSSHPHLEGEWIMCDGFVLDISNRKLIENELSLYRKDLERLVKVRTENLEATNKELNLYKTQLENMVDEKTRQQDILINILQILQSSVDIPEALNAVLAKIGHYTGASRVYIFENDAENTSTTDTYEWCNEGIQPMLNFSKQSPLTGQRDAMIDRDGYAYVSGVNVKDPVVAESLDMRGCFSMLTIPLVAGGEHYGFIGFDECRCERQWEKNEINLLVTLSQIISNTMRRHRAETAIHLSQQTLRNVLNNIDANIFVSDFDTSEILFTNEKFREEICNVEGRRCWEILQKDATGPCSFCPVLHLRGNNEHPAGPYYWEYHNPNNHYWYACNDTAIEWTDGRWVHLQHAMNISQRKKVELELIQAKEKAEEADKLKSAFLANMSHEIHTPLNGITGFLNFMDDDNLPVTRRREYISIINNSADLLSKLIENIVDVAILEAGQMNLFPVAFRLNDLMEDLFAYYDFRLYNSNKSHTAMVLDRTGFINQCVCYIDSLRLRQILVHLIDNALKFLDKGYVSFGYRQIASGLLEFTVADSGVGIPEDQQKFIFERFRKSEHNLNRQNTGTGLGLAISHSLVQMMGGDMRVESTERIGSTFYFTISYMPVQPADVHIFGLLPGKKNVIAAAYAGKTLLLAEPQILKYMYYEKLLSTLGFTVIRADRSQHWYESLNEKTDVVVVSLSGCENFKDGVSIPDRFKTPIIYIASGQPENCNHPVSRHPNSVTLDEPVNFNELTNALELVMK